MHLRRRLVAGLIVAASLISSSAWGDEPTKQQCVDADTNAQSLRSANRLIAARDALRVCVSQSCPQVIQKDCTERLDELDRVQPTLVFAAQDDAGNDLSAVKVTLDGKPFLDSLDGPAVPMDPGPHDLIFEAAGRPPISRHIILHEGDKGRREQILFKSSAGGTTNAAGSHQTNLATEPSPEGAGASNGSTQRVLGIAAAGVGVVGVALGAVLGLSASSSWSSSQNECASPTNCSNHSQAVSDHDSAVSKGTISTVGFIAGGALIAGGAVLFFTAPKSSASPTVGLTPTLGGAVVRGTF